MLNLPANCPTIVVIIGAIVTLVGWPVTAWLAYRLGLRSQRMRIEWEAQKGKQSLRKRFLDLANDLKATVSTSGRPHNWVEIFKEKATQLISDYETIKSNLTWNEKKRMDEAMNTMKRFAIMDPDDIHAACGNDSELFDALKKFPDS